MAQPGKRPKARLAVTDRLAMDRTLLANERTFLAYVRTFFTALITGVSFIKFFPDSFLETVGWALFPAAGLTLAWGVYSALKTRRQMAGLR